MLNKKEIKQLIEEKKLLDKYIDLQTQLTPNGFDLTVGKIFKFNGPGKADFSNKERVLPQTEELIPIKEKEDNPYGWWQLEKGVYKVRTNEIVNLPANLVALSFSRSTFLRMGAYTQHGVWDAGFCGRGEFVLVVDNCYGIHLKQNARIAQLVFFSVSETEKYQGCYNGL